MRVLFDVRHLYYLPQYEPVADMLQRRGAEVAFLFYHSEFDQVVTETITKKQLSALWVEDDKAALSLYNRQPVDWIFFGNNFQYLAELNSGIRSVQMGHGIGPKRSYYSKSSTSMHVRFVEGAHRTQRLQALYPDDTFVDVGFAKLDPIINGTCEQLDPVAMGLDPNKPTILYSPTFYPSSLELFARDWPDHFKEFNLIVKPHHFSLVKPRYRKQKQLLEHWSSFPNTVLIGLEESSIVPFLAIADILISEASSTLFEFAVLNKPVIWCDFVKLRWSYRGPFRWRYQQRMDSDYQDFANIALHAARYSDVRALVERSIANPDEFANNRTEMAEKLAGRVDGRASERIADYLFGNQSQSPELHTYDTVN